MFEGARTQQAGGDRWLRFRFRSSGCRDVPAASWESSTSRPPPQGARGDRIVRLSDPRGRKGVPARRLSGRSREPSYRPRRGVREEDAGELRQDSRLRDLRGLRRASGVRLRPHRRRSSRRRLSSTTRRRRLTSSPTKAFPSSSLGRDARRCGHQRGPVLAGVPATRLLRVRGPASRASRREPEFGNTQRLLQVPPTHGSLGRSGSAPSSRRAARGRNVLPVPGSALHGSATLDRCLAPCPGAGAPCTGCGGPSSLIVLEPNRDIRTESGQSQCRC